MLALNVLSRPAVRNLTELLEKRDWEATKWVLEKISGKPAITIHTPDGAVAQINLLATTYSLEELLGLREAALQLAAPQKQLAAPIDSPGEVADAR